MDNLEIVSAAGSFPSAFRLSITVRASTSWSLRGSIVSWNAAILFVRRVFFWIIWVIPLDSLYSESSMLAWERRASVSGIWVSRNSIWALLEFLAILVSISVYASRTALAKSAQNCGFLFWTVTLMTLVLLTVLTVTLPTKLLPV